MWHLIRSIALTLLMSGAAFAGTVNVSAAVSLKEAMTDAAKAFESRTGQHVALTFGASGTLAAQIVNGAPVDAFISAASKQVNELDKAGMVEAGSRRVVARNALVLIVPPDEQNPPADFKSLPETTGKIAIGEPKTVPAGQYAMEVLRKLQIADKIADRVVYGASVRQVLDYVQRGEAAAGIVYATDAKEAGDAVKVAAVAEERWHEPIVYPGVVIKGCADPDGAKKFLDFLATPAGRAILIARGFLPPDAGPATGPAEKSE
jgi:molybdate transport system substrate-binding protein